MRKLRVATYNIHKARGLDRRVLPARIAEVIAEVDPDVIGLQEVLSIEGSSRELDQARFLAETLGMHLVLGSVRTLNGGQYGNVTLSRFPLSGHCAFDLTVPGREQRGCIRADVRVEERLALHVFNFHLGTAFRERRLQARRIVEGELIRSGELSGPRIVLGDFNEWTRGLVSRTLAMEFRSADIRLHLRARSTYPGVFPLLHLDHIYYDEALVIEAVRLHRTRKALIASDHLPLVADFGVKDQK